MLITENSVLKQLIKYVGPAVLGLLINALYNIVDRIFVGQFVGAEGLSAVTMVFPVFLFQFGFVLLFGSGTGVMISKYLGESKPEKAEIALGNMIAGLLIIIVLFTGSGLLFYRPLLELFGAQGDLLNLSAEYLQVIIFGFPLSFFIALEFTCRAEGNPRLPAKLILISSVINITLDIVFMKGLDMGVRGAGLATIIAQGVNSVFLIAYYIRGKSLIRLVWKNIKLQKDVILPMLLLGSSPFIMDCATSIQNVIANNLLLKSGGTEAVAVMGIIFGVNVFFMMTALGIGDGIQPIISFNLGAKKHLQNYKTLLYTMIIVASIGILGVILLELLPNKIISIFINKNEEIRSLAKTALRIFALSIPFYMVQIIATRYFQALHKNRIAIFFALLRPILLFIPIAYTLNWMFGLNGVWTSFVVTDSLAALVSIVFIKKMYPTKL
ncbi:MATE family efflux transporter [uncultured Formosa sp.]|uniref:MATE family efflux transporter n=1 Tax=uncultured Formosa sp. TaxID=255435 RepID=UPI00261B11DD|nr:MATE family efflux transporter [uncultured Formosa sp.]